MGSSYYRWSTIDTMELFLTVANASGGVTGLTPQVAIRRVRESQNGLALDNYYWDGAAFVVAPQWLNLSPYDAANQPGLYRYLFEQPGNEYVYLVYFRNTAAPIGFAVEEHVVTNEIYIPTPAGVIPPDPTSLKGLILAMQSATGAVALANADAVWDEILAGHLSAGSTGEALANCAAAYTGLYQTTITIRDTLTNPIQGAQVAIYDATNIAFLTKLFTDANGKVIFALDPGNYSVRIFASGYSFTVPEPLLVTADGSVTYTGISSVVINPPSAPDLCVIYGTLRDVAGRAMQGACVKAIAITPQTVDTNQKSDRPIITKTDADGFFQLELVRNTQVNLIIADADLDVELTVPDVASQELTAWLTA